ncbi:MAG TPA: hypothetical protein VNH42_03175 [Mariprofundaceae bacterium]|nr:hypothetical protein [Mariprofundaceae bacterium]
MKYSQFIDALEPLIEGAKTLFDREELDEGQDFRRWRHQLTELIHRIEDEGYAVNCSLAGRYFDEPYYMATRQERLDAYNRDLQDTVNELKAVVAGYGQSGEPGKSVKSGASLSRIKRWWNR